MVANEYVGPFAPGDVFVLGKELPHVFRSDPAYFAEGSALKTLGISLFFEENYFGERFWNLTEMEAVRRLVREASGGLRITGSARTDVAERLQAVRHTGGLEKMLAFFGILHVLSRAEGYERLSVAEASAQVPAYEQERMHAVVQFTLQAFREPISIEAVARVANLTPEAFCRYFKLRTRKTYLRFLHEVRIQQACTLLREGRYAVESVAFQTGFNNRANFNRVFKMLVGKTPSEYVRQNR